MVFLLRITCKAPLFFNILVLLCNLIFIQCTDVSNKEKERYFAFSFFLFCLEMFHQLFNYQEIKISIILGIFFCKEPKLNMNQSCNYWDFKSSFHLLFPDYSILISLIKELNLFSRTAFNSTLISKSTIIVHPIRFWYYQPGAMTQVQYW